MNNSNSRGVQNSETKPKATKKINLKQLIIRILILTLIFLGIFFSVKTCWAFLENYFAGPLWPYRIFSSVLSVSLFMNLFEWIDWKGWRD